MTAPTSHTADPTIEAQRVPADRRMDWTLPVQETDVTWTGTVGPYATTARAVFLVPQINVTWEAAR